MKNKYILTLALSLLGLTSTGLAADRYESNPQMRSAETQYWANDFVQRIIVVGSVMNAGYVGNDSGNYSQPNAYSAGALVDLFGYRHIVLESGLLFRHLETSPANGIINNSLTANYLALPVSVKYYFNGQGSTSSYAKLGAMGSALLSDNKFYTSPTNQVGARTWETSLVAGLGVKLNFTEMMGMIAEINYTRGLESLVADSSLFRSDIGLTLGFVLNI